MTPSDAFTYLPDGLPDDLLGLPPLEVLARLGRPTLLRVPGRGTKPPRAISTLLHGDESTGLEAILTVLAHPRTYERDLYVVIGNVAAALDGDGFEHRYLDDQEDFNRIWGLEEPTTAQRLAADGILAELRAAGLEALVDIHNNTGNNPFYAIVTQDAPRHLNLATLFTTTLLTWDLRAHTMMEAMHDEVASIAVECGLPGRPESLAFAIDGIRRFLGEPDLEDDVVLRDYDLYGDLRKVRIRPEVRFRFGGELDDGVDLVIDADADDVNFRTVAPGHVIGHVRPGGAMPLVAESPGGRDVTLDHFEVDRTGRVLTTATATPVMMTRTVAAARKDCLFYLSTAARPN